MRLYSFEIERYASIGAEHEGELVDLAAADDALRAAGAAPKGATEIPPVMWVLLRRGAEGLEAARRAIAFAASLGAAPEVRTGKGRRNRPRRLRYRLDAVRLLAPVPHPRKVLCCAANDGSSRDEPDAASAAGPSFYAKLPNALIGPGEPIVRPRMVRQLVPGGSLAVVMGRGARNLRATEAMGYVAGYTILNDVVARDPELGPNRLTLGPNFDTFAPLGPCVVTADELTEPGALRLRTRVNGEPLRDASTAAWVFGVPELLAGLSRALTLEPGDIVGAGAFRDPARTLEPGDVFTTEIEGVGVLENPVVAER